MSQKIKFDIIMDEVTFCIPIGVAETNYLAKAIKNSDSLTKITIQEDVFDEVSWKILSQGIIMRKFVGQNFKLQIQFTIISASNIAHICHTITKSWIKELILHDCFFEGDTFDLFCSKITKASGIRRVEMTTNHLTVEQIEKLQKVLGQIAKTVELSQAKVRKEFKSLMWTNYFPF